MIHIMLSDFKTCSETELILNKQIIKWCRENIQAKNLLYKIHYCRPYLYTSDYIKEAVVDEDGIIIQQEEKIYDDDYILWNAYVAGRNLDVVKQYKYSLVVLEKQTLLNQKISVENPINEVIAINYGFYIMYLNEKVQLSKEWKLAIQADNYLMSQDAFLKACMVNPNNFKQQNVEHKEIFDDNKTLKNQINI